MNINKNTILFNLLRRISSKPETSQRDMANSLDISLGKLNYCLKALKSKGLIKISNFRKSKNKLGYIYLLTPKGVSHKTQLTVSFMKAKLKEYDELKKELEQKKNTLHKK
tara:strand:+ start:64 stop:393 length:330 start_codon:yes stop_codon:yes gene_type:complete